MFDYFLEYQIFTFWTLKNSNIILREDKNKGLVSSTTEYVVNSYKDAVILFKKGY